jgi:hypothetical protein
MRLIRVVDGPVARYLPATGLMLVSTGVEAMYNALRLERPDAEQQDEVLAFMHEVVHHLQAVSCAYLWQNAVAYVDAAADLLAPRKPDDRTRAIAEIARRERAWRLRAYGVSVADLCEGAAVLESYKAYARNPSVEEFLGWRDHTFPGKGNSVYRRTFDILADECGADAAFDLLPVITLLALQGDIPGRSFEVLVSHKDIKRKDLLGAPARQIMDALGMRPPLAATATPEDLARLHPKHQHPTLYPVLIELVRTLGQEMLETLARPHLAFQLPLRDALLPPLVVGTHRQGGSVSMAFGVGRADKNLRLMVLIYSAMIAAARRVVTGTTDFVPCPHAGCPNHASGMCSGNVVPPPEPELCRFREDVRALQGKELHEIAADCTALVSGDAVAQVLSSHDHDTIFPGAEKMPIVAQRQHETRAELFDQRHLLDAEDNDGLLMLTCPQCHHFWQEWSSRRKLDAGFMAQCPACGRLEEIQTDRIAASVFMDKEAG